MAPARTVNIGRIALIKVGDDAGKLAAIVDVVDQNRALADGPGLARQMVNFKHIALTDLTVKLGRGARSGTVAKAWAKNNIDETWAKTSWAKKHAVAAKRAATTDFERFKIVQAKKKRAQAARNVFNKLKAAAKI